jgi:heavy metal translocating P-type ATPase
MQIGSLLEDYTANRAQKGVAALLKLTPRTARILRNEQHITVPVENVSIGDTLLVLAGETIPVDGFLLSGHATLNQAVMTGESLPVDKITGDPLLSGTQNQYQPLEMRASKTSGNSSLQRLLQLAAAADANKAPIVKLADRWAGYLVVAALACACITYAVTGIFLRAVTVLVVICPCAFVLATPTAVAAAIGNLTRYGILIRTGDALERLAGVTTVAFDKTGTLTYGQPHILAVQALNAAYSPEAILKLAATAEQKSEHPLGKAIVDSYARTGQTLPPVQNCLVWPGQGLEAESLDLHLRIGKAEFFKLTPPVLKTAEQYLHQGATVIFLAVNGKLAGLLALADVVRARGTVQPSRHSSPRPWRRSF